METSTIILGALIIFGAGVTYGLSSFGFALVAIPLLNIILPTKFAILTVLLLSNVPRILLIFETRKWIELDKFLPLIIPGILGAFVGSNLLINLNTNMLKMVVSVVTTLAALAFLADFKRPGSSTE